MSKKNQGNESLEALLDRKLQPLQDKIVALNNTVEGMANSLTFLNSQYEDLLNKVKNMEEEKKEAAAETLRLKTEVLKLNNEIGSWRTNFDNLEQYSRRDCLEIRGVPVTEREDTTKIISNVGSMIGVEINETDVSISHRLPAPRSSTVNTTNVHPSIIVKFVRRELRERFYAARKNLREKSTSDLGFSRTTQGKIYIVENLTPRNKLLFKNSLQAKRELSYRFIWTRQGKIFLRQSSDSPAVHINNEQDLQKLFGK